MAIGHFGPRLKLRVRDPAVKSMSQFNKEICGDLDAAIRREWLETNGLGGFASSTIVGLNTRRYHGLLVAATKPPVGRVVMLAKLEETLLIGGRAFELSTNRYPGVVHPQGFQKRVISETTSGKTETGADDVYLWMPDSINKLEAAIIFASAGELVPIALERLERGGVVVCGGIHMSDIPSFPYVNLWQERAIVSVANLTRRDAIEFLELAPLVPVRTETHEYPLTDANKALGNLRSGKLTGAAVLVP